MNFDAHSDIWTDVTRRRLEGERDVFRRRHYERLKKGEIEGAILVVWNDPPYDADPLKRTRQTMEAIAGEEKEAADILKIARSFADITAAKREGKFYALIGLEGLKSIGGDVELIEEFYRFGARHAGLTWNEENPLATGVRGTPKRGLTELGKRAVKKIQALGMLLDVSHLNAASFWELLGLADGPVIASHSNAAALCPHPRNLTDSQLKELARTGGVAGLNAFHEFVHKEKEKQTLENLVKHLVYMTELMGVDHVGFGFDFSEFLETDTISAFDEDPDAVLRGLEDASAVPKLIKEMKRAGFHREEIEKIAYKNWLRVLEEVLR